MTAALRFDDEWSRHRAPSDVERWATTPNPSSRTDDTIDVGYDKAQVTR